MNRFLPVFVLGMLVASCAPSGTFKDALERNDSIVAAVMPIQNSLQKSEDLRFRLLCAKDVGDELVEIASVAALKGSVLNGLIFTLAEPVTIGSICRVEIRALTAGVYASTYEFLVAQDLFYASTKGLLEKSGEGPAALDIAIYKVYRDLAVESKTVATELSFPVGVESVLQVNLVCGDKKYAATATITAAEPIYRSGFAIPYQDLVAPLPCDKITATNTDGSLSFAASLTPVVEVPRNAPVTIKAALTPITAADGSSMATPATP